MFTSTLTSEDENRLAPALLTAVTSILDLFPVAYRFRIDTADGNIYQTVGPSGPSGPAADLPPAQSTVTIKFLPRDSGA